MLYQASHPLIELRRLHRFYGKTHAVNDVSFEVDRGQVFGFIGPNGAGKTTSMRILATLDLPTYGDALIDGFSSITDPDLVRKRMGFMPDGFGTYPYMNCEEYLDFFARSYGMVGMERVRGVRRVLGFTGLDKIADKPINGLSKGMRQRLSLGRAMIHDPAVLILDEPANGLDPRARIELRQMIRQLAVDGKAILVSSHILTELAEMVDHVGIIERGNLLAVGCLDEIRRKMQGSTVIEVNLLENADQCRIWLSSRTPTLKIEQQGNRVRFDFSGTEREQAELLRSIILEGFFVLAWTAETHSLEDIFMQITTGAVQ